MCRHDRRAISGPDVHRVVELDHLDQWGSRAAGKAELSVLVPDEPDVGDPAPCTARGLHAEVNVAGVGIRPGIRWDVQGSVVVCLAADRPACGGQRRPVVDSSHGGPVLEVGRRDVDRRHAGEDRVPVAALPVGVAAVDGPRLRRRKGWRRRGSGGGGRSGIGRGRGRIRVGCRGCRRASSARGPAISERPRSGETGPPVSSGRREEAMASTTGWPRLHRGSGWGGPNAESSRDQSRPSGISPRPRITRTERTRFEVVLGSS